jgi:hypothetical protein
LNLPQICDTITQIKTKKRRGFKMSFLSAIEKIKKRIAIQPSVDALMKKYEKKLHYSTNSAVERLIPVKNEVKPRLCVFMKPGADIDAVQEMYEKVGIKLKKYLYVLGHRRSRILYIDSDEFAKLDQKRQKFFERTTSNNEIYEQNLTHSVKKERSR